MGPGLSDERFPYPLALFKHIVGVSANDQIDLRYHRSFNG